MDKEIQFLRDPVTSQKEQYTKDKMANVILLGPAGI